MDKYKAGAIGSFVVMAAIFVIYALLSFNWVYGAGAAVIFAIYLAAFFAVSRKGLHESALQSLTFLHLAVLTAMLAFVFFNLALLLVTLVIISAALFAVKIFSIRDILKTLFMFIVVFIAATTLFQPAVVIAAGQGTVLSDNWWNSLNWIKNNTAQCAVVATYWDPGHFITGIANRPVVFDGASQNALWNKTADAGISYEQMKDIAGTEKFRYSNITADGQQKTLIETARIQDIATTLATSNETQALKILEKYRTPGCNEMYYLATADLIGKSFWWTYFSSWNPIDKGCGMPMTQIGLKQAKPAINGGITYTYEGGISLQCNNQIGAQVIISQQNDTMQAFVLRNNQLEQVEQFIYFTEQGGILRTQPNAPVKAMIFMDPSRQSVIFIPGEIKDSMFTKMFLFNGQGLKNFEFVDSWGGEVKLFRIRFNETAGG